MIFFMLTGVGADFFLEPVADLYLTGSATLLAYTLVPIVC